jgi:hypothetical protein
VYEDVLPLLNGLMPGIDAKPPLPAPIAMENAELAKYAGVYRRLGLDWRVTADTTGLVLSTVATPQAVEVSRTPLTAVGDDTFAAGVMGIEVQVHFPGAKSESPAQYIRVGNRAARRVED